MTINRTALGASLLALLAIAAIVASSASAAVPDLLTRTPESRSSGSGAGAMNFPWSVAVSPVLPGNVYVSDRFNNRIDEYSPWGDFLKAWGWGVNDGLNQLEQCTSITGCRPGTVGSGSGQFDSPEGLAVGPNGDVYVVESGNHRVQVFNSSGQFLFMFGVEVNETKTGESGTSAPEKNLCTAASGDVCKGGVAGSGPGQFGGSFASYTNALAIDPAGGTVFIGEGERIQLFDASGAFDETIALPPGGAVNGVTLDGSGNLYASFFGNAAIRKLKPVGPNAEFLSPTFAVKRASALAVDSSGKLYAVVSPLVEGGESQPEGVITFDPAGNCQNCGVDGEGGRRGFDQSSDPWGIATGSACGPADLYVSHFDPQASPTLSYLNIFGEAPNPSTCPPPMRAPEIRSQFATSVRSDEATLGAQINPRFFSDTTYSVEYGTQPCSLGGCQSAPVPPATLTSQVLSGPITAPVTLTGLLSETTYHYRFVAQSGGGGPVTGAGGEPGHPGSEATFSTFPDVLSPPTCANDVFRIGLSAPLPDCRAYEMVSPVNKEGGYVSPGPNDDFTYLILNQTLAEAAADGDRATFSSLRAFADPQAAPLYNQYLAVRGEGGWSTSSISPPRSDQPIYGPGFAVQYKSFSEDLCNAWLVQDSDVQLAPGAPAGFVGIYRRDNCVEPGHYTSLANVVPPGIGTGSGEVSPAGYLPMPLGHSADGTKNVFRADAKLTSNACATPGLSQTYESADGGPLRLISVLPSGVASCDYSYLGTSLGFRDWFRESSVYHAVSGDGERVYWTNSSQSVVDLGDGGPTGPGTLYLRLNATKAQGKCSEATKACTVAVSAGGEARFWAATPDGAEAIYSEGEELFRYDLATTSSTLIAKGLTGVIGASEDLSRIYLISTEALSGTQKNSAGDEAVAGQPNVYLEEGGSFVFVATLGGEEGNGIADRGLPSAPGNVEPWLRTSRVSPDGSHLAFTSAQPLTGYDNADAVSGEPDAELFLYDAASGAAGNLACVSCNPSGSRPSGQEVARAKNSTVPFWASAQLPGWAENQKPTRLLTPDGARLYFESFDALVPRDTNGRRDVYEWERSTGKAQCQERGAEVFAPTAGGCLSLISSGTGEKNSELIDASAGGHDVFFATEASLLPQDPGNFDVYDAREGGGFAGVVKPAVCEGEACQSPGAAPLLLDPGSTVAGPGNPKPRCAKGTHRVKKNGKSHCAKDKKHQTKGKGKTMTNRANKSGRAAR